MKKMRSIKNISIKKGIHALIISVVVFVSILFILHYLFYLNAEYKEKKLLLQIYSTEKQKAVLRHQVESVIRDIDFQRSKHKNFSDSLVQRIVLENIERIRFEHGGYVFANTYQGQALVFDGSIVEGHKDISKLKDPDGKPIFDIELKACQLPDGDFMTYRFKPIGSDTLLPKISYMKGYTDWQWIIGAGFYLNDIKHELSHIEDQFYLKLKKDILISIPLFVLINLIVILFANYFIRFLSKELSLFTLFFNRLSLLNKKIDTSGIVFTDLRDLANEANKMIDEKQILEEELQKSEANYRALVEQASDAIVKDDKEGNFIQVNTSACRLTGYSRQELLKMNRTGLFVKEKIETKPIRYDELEKGKAIVAEQFVKTKQGKRIPVELSTSKISDGSLLSIIRDISERKSSEKQLNESQARYKSLYENAAIPIFEEDFSEVKAFFDHIKKEGITDFRKYFDDCPSKVNECIGLVKILDVNEVSLKLFNTNTKADLLNSFPRFFDEDSISVFKEELIALAEGRMEFNCEISILDLKENKKYIDLRLAVTPGYETNLSRVLVSFIDITERKETEFKLKQYRTKLEEMVKERTAEIELKNAELIEKNEKLEHFNQLFVGREFRIKELRDRVKELEEKQSKS